MFEKDVKLAATLDTRSVAPCNSFPIEEEPIETGRHSEKLIIKPKLSKGFKIAIKPSVEQSLPTEANLLTQRESHHVEELSSSRQNIGIEEEKEPDYIFK